MAFIRCGHMFWCLYDFISLNKLLASPYLIMMKMERKIWSEDNLRAWGLLSAWYSDNHAFCELTSYRAFEDNGINYSSMEQTYEWVAFMAAHMVQWDFSFRAPIGSSSIVMAMTFVQVVPVACCWTAFFPASHENGKIPEHVLTNAYNLRGRKNRTSH